MAIHPSLWKHLVRKILLLLILTVAVLAIVWWRQDHEVKQTANSAQQTQAGSAGIPVYAGFDKNIFPTNIADSPWVVVNKGRQLPVNFVPVPLVVPNVTLTEAASSENMHLRADAAASLEVLIKDAADDGVKLILVSGYRSYTTQQSVYAAEVRANGQAAADKESARPGHSEHQTGLAADLGASSGKCQLEACFGDTAEGKWLAANAYKDGFIVRYQKDKTSLTGYAYEPWHIRYVRKDLSTEIYKSGQTLEQLFGLPAYPDYPSQSYELKTSN